MKPIASFNLLVGAEWIEVLLASPNCDLDYSAIIGEAHGFGLLPASKEIVQRFLEEYQPVVQGFGQDYDVETIVALGSLHILDGFDSKLGTFPVVRIPKSYDQPIPQWEDGRYLYEQPCKTRKSACDLVLLVRTTNHGSEVVTL